jgi:hypothetical protein
VMSQNIKYFSSADPESFFIVNKDLNIVFGALLQLAHASQEYLEKRISEW